MRRTLRSAALAAAMAAAPLAAAPLMMSADWAKDACEA